MNDSDRFMHRVLEVARRYHSHIRGPSKGGWSDLAHLLSDPSGKISAQMIGNWRHRKLPERADYFIAKKIGCTVEELWGQEEKEELISEESMTPEERMLVTHYRRAEPEKQAALFKIVTGQPRPAQPPAETPSGNVVAFGHKRKK